MNEVEAQTPWPEWQEEYRHGAFFIFPPEDVRVVVDELRRRYDAASASYCQAHVSLSEPLASPLTKEQTLEITTALSNFAPFEVRYGPLRTFEPHPGVTYAIGPEDTFFNLRDVVHTTSAFAGREKRRAAIPPHMTIAEFISIERTRELLAELSSTVLSGTFWCGHVVYAVPDTTFNFRSVLHIPLDGREHPT
ncbi:MAG TPA: 2'-5' RNA ligase family protein [Acidimicrobiales bacterium]|nr:2'-5' RNA ligase family protein [Acidimicrobiales bacterium]